jgi:hypothetical protein
MEKSIPIDEVHHVIDHYRIKNNGKLLGHKFSSTDGASRYAMDNVQGYWSVVPCDRDGQEIDKNKRITATFNKIISNELTEIGSNVQASTLSVVAFDFTNKP